MLANAPNGQRPAPGQTEEMPGKTDYNGNGNGNSQVIS